MNTAELIQQWNKLRDQVIIAQLAPSALLITSVALLQFGLADARLWVKLAFAGILLASGILGALAEYAAATEAMAVAADITSAGVDSRQAKQIIAFSPWLNVVRFVTPAIFVAIFGAILFALFLV
ncbi:MAG: hypothetical protein RL196_1566 [Actinomycetota bacterium]|jgi:hypothetical protein